MIYCKKSFPPPSCLAQEKVKASGDYKCGDVLERLYADFHGKCYLCESSQLTSINVEHLRPHEGDSALKFAWENLFLSCSHCNNTKLNQFRNIIDCTNHSERIEERISYHFSPFPYEKPSFRATDEEESTQETVELLDKIFGGTSIIKSLEGANLRDALLKEICNFQATLVDYFDERNDQESKKHFLIGIKRHLSMSSEFLSFKRWIIMQNDTMKAELGYLLNHAENRLS